MFDPVRNPEGVLQALAAACKAHPDQRVTQVIVNAVHRDDPFYIEDDVCTAALWAYAATGGSQTT